MRPAIGARWILLIAGLAIALGALAIRPAAKAQTPDDPALLRELLDRLLTATSEPGASATAHVTLGALPADLPLDVPVPSGSRIIGGISQYEQPADDPDVKAFYLLALDSPLNPDATRDFYRTTFTARGYAPPPMPSFDDFSSMTGFVPAIGTAPRPIVTPTPPDPSGPLEFCVSDDGPKITTLIKPGNVSAVTVAIEAGDDFYDCMPDEPRTSAPSTLAAAVPLLPAPAGSHLLYAGLSNSAGSVSLDGDLRSTMSAAELLEYYVALLRQSGWMQTSLHADSPVAWASWAVPGGNGDRRALLLIYTSLSPGTAQLRLEVAAPSEQPPGASGNFATSASASLFPVGSPAPRPTPTPTPSPTPASRSAATREP